MLFYSMFVVLYILAFNRLVKKINKNQIYQELTTPHYAHSTVASLKLYTIILVP